MAATTVHLEVSEGAAWITLDGPTTRNALDATAAADLIAACDRIDDDEGIGVAVITGSGGTFCSGADTRVLDELRTARPDQVYTGLDEVYRAFRRFGALAVPSVAAVDGAAVGAGVNLALAADLRILSDTATFISGFARLGLHPGGGHLHLLTRAGGAGLAAAMGMFALPINAEQAVTSGLAHRAVAPDQLREAVSGTTAHLSADPELARALTLTWRRTVLDTATWDRAIDGERARQMWSLTRTKES